MLTNLLKTKVLLRQKQVTQGALGQKVTWVPVQEKHASVRPLDAKSRATYMQLNSEVTHIVTFRGDVTITVGDYLIEHGSKTYQPVNPAKKIKNMTAIEVKEI